MSNNSYIFTSESVAEGHPDKIADQISDRILDALINVDKNVRSGIETMVTSNLVILSGETSITDFNSQVDVDKIVRNCVRDIGYAQKNFHWENLEIINKIHGQSPDIAQGVDETDNKDLGAGDQGIMFGYATNETDVLMPAPIQYAHRLVERQSECRNNGTLPLLRPDAKSQVSFHYKDGKPVSIDAVVLSTQHAEEFSGETLREAIMEEVIKPVLEPTGLLTANTKFHINPTGNFVIGGPMGDAGLTGRKIIVDTYGGAARHGGGAFSGKDPSKVDRSAAYAGRYVAKNIVAAGLADRCEIQVSYAIGVAEPTSIMIDTFGTGKISDERITELVREHFDLRPYGILKMLDLLNAKQIKYRKTAAYGHFGRENEGFTWEMTDKADALRDAAGL